MHSLTALSLKNRALIALVTIVAAVFGLIGVGSLKQELMPSVQFPAIVVVTAYPGAAPEVVNSDVSGPIETALRGVPNLESTTATSSTGMSMVIAQFEYGVDIAATEQKAERAISRIQSMLPEAADPQVASGSIDDFPVIQIAVTPAEGEDVETAAERISRIAIPELNDLDGVREAQLTGALGNRITLVPYPDVLAANGLSTQSLTDALQQSGFLMPAGTITEDGRTLSVTAGSEIASAEEIAAIPIARNAQEIILQQQAQLENPGAEVAPAPVLTIGNLAEVRVEPNPVTSISRVDGQPALTIAVTKLATANTVEVSHAVQGALDELSDQLSGAKLTVIFDQAPYIEQSIETLTVEGLLGLVFAVLVILLFLMSVRATLVTAISIPTSVLLTFVGLNFADYTLNLLTLGALTISIGRVVDDSIVVIENIKRHLAERAAGIADVQRDRAGTIIEAVREVAGAITASTLTTVAVFLPMAFVAGMVGELFRPFAFTVTIALVASLLVSLTIVPVLAYWFLHRDNAKPNPKRQQIAADGTVLESDHKITAALQRWYRPVIEWTLRRPAATLLIALVVFGATMAATPLMKTNYLGADEQNSVGLTQQLAAGTSLEVQLAAAEEVETALAGVDAVESVQVTIGSAGSGMAAIFGGGGDGAVTYSITTDSNADQVKVQDEIRAAVDGLEDAGEFSIGSSGGGMSMTSAIEVVVTAPDQATLTEAADAVQAALAESDELTQVESNLSTSRPYLSVVVDRAGAAAAGLSEVSVAAQLAAQMQPSQIGQISIDETMTTVYLQNTVSPTDQAGVAALPIQTAVGPRTLESLAVITVADGPVSIGTQDGVRTATISALGVGDDLTKAGTAVTQALETVELPAGANAEIGGVMAQQGEAFSQLGLALLAAILIVYVVMVATFRSLLQPLLLLISVPFAATGALILLIVTGIPLGVASLIGVLMLIGIVVTNAIVLIDLVNQYRNRGDSLRDAVLNGSLQRLRPIVMTALATILALTPMGLGITGKGGFISQPLAVVVIGGLLSSTVMTLVVLPTLYYIVERRRERPRGGDDGAEAIDAGPTGGLGAPALAGAGALNAGFDAGSPLTPSTLTSSEEGDAEPPAGPRRRGGAVAAPVAAAAATSAAATSATTAAGSTAAAVPGVAGSAHAVPAVSTVPVVPAVPAVPAAAADPVETESPEASSTPSGDDAQNVAEVYSEIAPAEDDPEAAARRAVVLQELLRVGRSAPAAPEEEPELEADSEVGPATRQMELSLQALGFDDEDADEDADELDADDVDADDENEGIVPLVLPSAAENEGDDEDVTLVAPYTPAEVEPAPVEPEAAPVAPVAEPVAESAESAEPVAEPANEPATPKAAPPVTGELDWEHLLWQATQEVDEDEESDSDTNGVTPNPQAFDALLDDTQNGVSRINTELDPSPETTNDETEGR